MLSLNNEKKKSEINDWVEKLLMNQPKVTDNS